MVKDTVTECLRMLQLASEDHDSFKKAAIEGIERHQTYHRDLLGLSKDDIEEYAIDFFLDGTNLSYWWPNWSQDQRTRWLSTARAKLEQALITLFDHWIESGRKESRKRDFFSLNGTSSRNKAVRPSVRRPSGATRPHHDSEAVKEGDLRQTHVDGLIAHEVVAGPSRIPIRAGQEPDQTPITPSTTNGSLPDINGTRNEGHPVDEDSDGLPSVSAILRGQSRSYVRHESKTIEPQSPPANPKGKHIAIDAGNDADSTYVASQMSTIGQPPMSPPPTRHRQRMKRKLNGNPSPASETDDDFSSPLAKRGRQKHPGTLQRNPSADEVGALEVVPTLAEMPTQEAFTPEMQPHVDGDNEEVIGYDEDDETMELREVDNRQGDESNFDAFEDLSRMLNQYIRECRDDTIQRANEQNISKRESEKCHIKSAVLHHLYGDVLSRIRAVNARRRGVDESNKITSHTLHS